MRGRCRWGRGRGGSLCGVSFFVSLWVFLRELGCGGGCGGNILGGPEIYAVARSEFTAGPAGNRTAKILLMTLEVSGALIAFSWFSCWTIGHSYSTQFQNQHQHNTTRHTKLILRQDNLSPATSHQSPQSSSPQHSSPSPPTPRPSPQPPVPLAPQPPSGRGSRTEISFFRAVRFVYRLRRGRGSVCKEIKRI